MKRKNLLLTIGLSLFVLTLVLTGCLTGSKREPLTADSARAMATKAAEDINNGKYTALTKKSCVPFMFESEELKSDKVTVLIWKGLSEAGYRLDNPQIQSVVPTNGATYQYFDTGWEAKTFFEEYVKDKGFLITITGTNGRSLTMVIAEGTQINGISALKVVK